MTNSTQNRPITVALVNDFELVLRGTESMLGQFPDRFVVTEIDVKSNPNHRVDLVLFDTYGHAMGGIERVRSLVNDPRVGTVAIYTWRLPPEQIKALLAAGAGGVLAKSLSADGLADSLAAVHEGETVVSAAFNHAHEHTWPGHDLGLTARESDVAAFLVCPVGLDLREAGEIAVVARLLPVLVPDVLVVAPHRDEERDCEHNPDGDDHDGKSHAAHDSRW